MQAQASTYAPNILLTSYELQPVDDAARLRLLQYS